jgi:hypothetical protein
MRELRLFVSTGRQLRCISCRMAPLAVCAAAAHRLLCRVLIETGRGSAAVVLPVIGVGVPRFARFVGNESKPCQGESK